jgi:serine phosphatase RsbU (regulator of sigma subunit)
VDLGQVIRDFPDAILIVDSGGLVILANDASARAFAGTTESLSGRRLTTLVPDDAVRARLEYLARSLAEPGGETSATPPIRATAVRLDGVGVDVDLTMGPVGTTDGDNAVVVVSLRNPLSPGVLEEPDEVWRYLDIAVRLTDFLSSVAGADEALASILPIMFSHLSWDVSCLWLVDSDRRHLICAATWPDDGGPTQAFEDVSRGIRPRVGDGLPGSAWGSGRPLVSRVSIGESRLLRQEAIRSCGLQTGLAFPLVAEAGVIGVIEVFTRRTQSISVRLLDGWASIGHQIGQLLDHMRAEGRLREEERTRSFLLEAATALSGAIDYGDALVRLAALSVPEVADLCLIDVKERDGSISRMAAIHSDPRKSDLVAELADNYPPEAGGPHPSNEVMQTGTSRWSTAMTGEYLRETTRDERHLQIVRELGFESYMCVPLQEGDQILGAITLVSAGSGRRFGAADLALAEELATRAASVVSSARRHETEHRLAQQLQRLLLPEHLPDVPGFDICVQYSAAAPQADAGGDFFDVVTLPSGRVGLLIGDVEGHDTVAAATMGQLRSASRALAGQVREPGELIDALRGSWELLGFERFATALFARLDPYTGEVTMASAGHLPPAHLDAGLRARFVPVHPSPPLGMHGAPATDHRLTLGPSEVLFLYTDGLVEERGVEIESHLGRLLAVLRAPDKSPLDALCEHVIRSFAPVAHDQHDDIAILAIQRHR